MSNKEKEKDKNITGQLFCFISVCGDWKRKLTGGMPKNAEKPAKDAVQNLRMA